MPKMYSCPSCGDEIYVDDEQKFVDHISDRICDVCVASGVIEWPDDDEETPLGGEPYEDDEDYYLR